MSSEDQKPDLASTSEGHFSGEVFGTDAYSPRQIAERVESLGVTKARLGVITTFSLAILAGGFIGLGAMFFTIVVSDSSLAFAAQRVLGGLVFSLGLILVILAGAELFTGNNLLVMALVAGRITVRELLANWTIVFLGNLVGAIGLTALVALSGSWRMGHIGEAAIRLAAAKTTIPPLEAFVRGVLCNVLVCLAVWLTMGARSTVDKIAAVLFPVTAFVAAGFEHSVANLYFIPLGIFLQQMTPTSGVPDITWTGFLHNIVPVSLGNIVGGSVMVGIVYSVIYRRGSRAQ